MNGALEPCGVLCIDKGAGCTSFDLVQKVRRLYHTKKVGHTGTLDPMATGVLVVLVGRAAKAAELLLAQEKEYHATFLLGKTTDTQDSTGKVLSNCAQLPTEQAVRHVCESFVGTTMQIPPMYSALKVGGQKLVDLARKGIEVERTPRPITISALTVTALDEAEGRYALQVACSKGTYIRTLCADIGEKLGCGAVMDTLRRTKNGLFSLERAVTIEELEQQSEEERWASLLPLEALFADCPSLHLSDFFARLAQNGCFLYQEKLKVCIPTGTQVALYDRYGFFALASAQTEAGVPILRVIKQFRI